MCVGYAYERDLYIEVQEYGREEATKHKLAIVAAQLNEGASSNLDC